MFGANDKKRHQKFVTKLIEKYLYKDNKFSNSVQIFVSEIQCNEENCVPIETLIILLGRSNEKWVHKILKPISEVSETDISVLNLKLPLSELIKEKELIIDQSNENENEKIAKDLEDHLDSILKKYDTSKHDKILTKFLEIVTLKLKNDSNTISPQVSNEVKVNVPNQIAFETKFERPIIVDNNDKIPEERHKKGVRQRGCPCCDPDNIDNIVDRMLYFNANP